MTRIEFVVDVNETRKRVGKNWWQWGGVVEGKLVRMKGYGTWVQRLEHAGCVDSGPLDCSVRDFLAFLKSAV